MSQQSGFPDRPVPGADAPAWLAQIRCVALDYGGTIDHTAAPRLGGSRQVDPACVPALRTMAGHGLTLVLSSNTLPGEHRTTALAAAGIDQLFRLILMSACIGMRKPEPGFYALITAAAHCQPGQTLHVGDNMTNDVIGPARYGMRTALLRPGITAEERQQMPPGTLVISHVSDLPRLLGRQTSRGGATG